MDPEITIREINTALDNGDLESAEEFNGYLTDWLARGGFTPDGYAEMRVRLTNAQWDAWTMGR